MKKQSILRIGMAVILAISIFMLIRQAIYNQEGENTYLDALNFTHNGETAPSATPIITEDVMIPAPIEDDDPNFESLYKIDLAALREVNPDVVGWILIPDTKINYPIVQSEDNDYYLKHTWKKKKNSVGSIFMESRNNQDFTDYNTIIYGHNMDNGSMFHDLTNYTKKSFWKKHPYVYILSDWGIFRYDIFACYKAKINEPTYGLSFNETQTRQDFLDFAFEKSTLDSQIVPNVTDQILTLSTCSGPNANARLVVQARMKMIETTIVVSD